jgi:hypothetical protein
MLRDVVVLCQVVRVSAQLFLVVFVVVISDHQFPAVHAEADGGNRITLLFGSKSAGIY